MVQLIRLPNVIIIILTQLLLRYCIIQPFVYADEPAMLSPLPDFLILMIVTLFLAIGGYVINDYFDVKIDSVNRPEKMVVNKFITPRNAIKVHLLLNGIAVLLGFFIAYRIRAISFGFIFPFISGLLWIYSAKYKRILFWGNFIVSVLSAFVILVVWLFEFFWLHIQPEIFASVLPNMGWVSKIVAGYALFAFLTSMIREIIKDMEDYEGDKKFDCQTIPVVYGIRFSRFIVAVLLIGTMILLGWAQFILYRLEMMMALWYFSFAVQIPAFYMLFKLFRASEKQDFHLLSSLCKVIMVSGILSMEVLLISN
ncbi:MAG: geranylgeranylglycerol-phosphate geranylgeranyltransferase [Bacteroidota bacterium]